jgi:transcriptional regulator with PAS, ATPase and Fis domain
LVPFLAGAERDNCHNWQMNLSDDVKAILNSLGAPAILLGDDYRILHANDDYQALYGNGRELRRKHCYEVSHHYTVPCDLAGETCPLKASRESGDRTRVLHVHHTPRGQEYVNVETLPVMNDDGSIRYFIEMMRPSDIARTQAGSDGLVGKSAAFQRMVSQIDRVAPSETSVLLLGETGTGKEIVARTIHERSGRAEGPFVPVECAGITESLFESEMFGHVRGAFTGATADKMGLVEAARGGTLFMDEVGEISPPEQVKLLRLLETQCFRRVGSTDAREADFRLICATNKDLPQLVADGRFREDLYYRLNVFDIELPPLRDRREDIPLLVESVLRRLDAPADMALSADARRCLDRYAFPGNVRELRNVIERATLMCDGHEIRPEHLPAKCTAGDDAAASPGSGLRTLEDVELDHLRRALARHQGDRRTLAAQLGISERALYRKLARLRERQ